MLAELLKIEAAVRAENPPFTDTSGYVQAEIASGIAALTEETDAYILHMQADMLDETTARITQLQADYRRKTNELEASFIINRAKWAAQLKHEVLYHSD